MVIPLCLLIAVALAQPAFVLAQVPATPEPAAPQPAEVKPAEPPGALPAGPAPAPIPEPAPPQQPAPAPPAQPTPTWGDVRLPEIISPADLNRLISDLPGTFEIADIRPAEKFADYHVPDSRNVTIPELVNNPVYIQGTMPLIIVDRDGSIAMAVGGIFAQRSQRPVKVLHGGLEAYWRETALQGVKTPAEPTAAGSPPGGSPAAGPPPQQQLPEGAPSSQPAVPRRSAGC